MPYMIKTKGALIHSRDGEGPDRPLYVIDDRREYPFERLPPGTDPLRDKDLLIRFVEEIPKGAEKAPTYQEYLDALGEKSKQHVDAHEAKAAVEQAEQKKKPKLR